MQENFDRLFKFKRFVKIHEEIQHSKIGLMLIGISGYLRFHFIKNREAKP